ncbi:hypothetical protein [uncultured Flavobacterium sp.]|uniref:hypothetical protein n=1 Tax=uncultured Flavobacterium sp. TaxID=165435 RepID=UPI0025CF22AB|nr:hypothetical protein [uncultured Flavobacterium sp.]
MTSQEYNKISKVYQCLTQRFDQSRNYQYDRFYKVYNSQCYIVEGENLEALKHFENLTLRHVYTGEYLESQHFGEDYKNSSLLVVEDGKVLVHAELGFIFLYILIFKMQEGIRKFLDLINELKDRHTGLIRSSDDGRILKMKVYLYDEFIPQFEAIPDFNLIFHLFALTNSNFMERNWDNEVEVYVDKIRKTLETLKIFNFDNINMHF